MTSKDTKANKKIPVLSRNVYYNNKQKHTVYVILPSNYQSMSIDKLQDNFVVIVHNERDQS